jgi:hypothetical protein
MIEFPRQFDNSFFANFADCAGNSALLGANSLQASGEGPKSSADYRNLCRWVNVKMKRILAGLGKLRNSCRL